MNIVLDAMGSDTNPAPEVEAAIQAARRWEDTHILLVGDEAKIQPLVTRFGGLPANVEIRHAADAITMQDKGMKLALKAKRKNSQTSMAIGMDLVKNGEADAFVTAGNTGGALSTAYFRLGLLEGVERPGLTALFPVRGGYCVVLDIGANPECKPEHILQFAAMGSVYARLVLGIENPRVGLISNGEEGGKGNELVKGAYPLLEASSLNFIGNVEGKELFGGQVDVAVTDGFTGNVVLKASEAVAKLMTDLLKEHLMSSTRTKLGALLAKPAFDALKKTLDPHEVGAAPLLGVNGLVFIGHGRSNAHALVNAIGVARQAVQSHLLEAVGAAIQTELAQLP
ncbi:MAG: phosphate acyltransferase PlsX [Anaerolineae bacterium]|nr:MAG: phosphate acyltransferase PlsX [Anaerolineae bacterium]